MNSLTKIIAISLTAFVAVVLLVMTAGRPLLREIDKLYLQSTSQSVELNTLNKQLSAYNEAKTQLANVNYKDAINNSIVAREDLAVVITEIETNAIKSNVKESITIADDKAVKKGSKAETAKSIIPNEKNISEVAYTLNFSGKFSDVLDFLQYLEHLPHFTEISALSFNAVQSTSGKDISEHTEEISGTINGVFFVKKYE